MENYIVEWLSLIFRWLHVITGIAWIGASFYFIWLDNQLETPPEWKRMEGIKGELWAIHGGGIYEVSKYALAPAKMPETLHWFKWEAYTTWLTGMVLLTLIYYFGAESYLIDPDIASLEKSHAIILGLSSIFGSYIIYEFLCRGLAGKDSRYLAIILIMIGAVIAFTLTQLFSGRGAYIHFGAIIGTLMVGNVFRVIMPSQRALLNAIEKQETLDPEWGQRAKLHSTHNTYLTLPIIFIMISTHYPMTYSHSYNWMILIAIIAITASARHFFVLRHKRIFKPIILLGALSCTLILAILINPISSSRMIDVPTTDPNTLALNVRDIVERRCSSCHSSNPTDDVFTVAAAGLKLDTMTEVRQWASRIKVRTVDSKDMPFMNKTGMLPEEREILGQWILVGAPLPN